MFNRLRKLADTITSGPILPLLIPVGMALVYKGVKAMEASALDATNRQADAMSEAAASEAAADLAIQRLEYMNEVMTQSYAVHARIVSSIESAAERLDAIARRLDALDPDPVPFAPTFATVSSPASVTFNVADEG